MKSNFPKNEETEKMDDIWMSADELLGDPSLPTTTAGIHYRAKQEHWRSRKREGVRGGKAIEYHLASLPPVNRASILARMGHETGNEHGKSDDVTTTFPEDGNEELMLKLYRSLPNDESKRRFFSRILVLTSEFLEAYADHANKEILCRGYSTENEDSAPQISTHNKKAG